MDSKALEKLTDKQRECLRMVLHHYSSKEMARELGIGVDAVDQRLKSAMRKLGVQSRFEAARMLAIHEGESPRLKVPGKAPGGRWRLARSLGNGIVSGIRSLLGLARKILPRSSRGRFVLWACLGGFAFNFMQLGDPLEYFLRDRNVQAHLRPASGKIVLVSIDERSVKAFGLMPWPRHQTARIFGELDRLGAATIVTPIEFDRRSDPLQDRQLASAFHGLRARLVLKAAREYDTQAGAYVWVPPLPEFQKRAVVGQGDLWGIFSTPRRIPVKTTLDRTYGSIFLELANVGSYFEESWIVELFERNWGSLPIDYTINPATIPEVSVADLLAKKVRPELIRGNNILLAISYPTSYGFAPGSDYIPGGRLQALAAETLIQGAPMEISWVTPYMATMLVIIACLFARNAIISAALLVINAILLLILPSIFFPYRTYIEVAPALFLLLLVGTRFSWSFVRSGRFRAKVHPETNTVERR